MTDGISTPQLLDPARALQEVGVKQGEKVADFGCGSIGHFVFPAARFVGKDGKVYAIDIQKSALSGIESRMRLENTDNVQPLWGDIERPNGVRVPDQTFHVALLVNNLFLVKGRDVMAEEVRRTTKAGGRLLVIDWLPSASPVGPAPSDRVTADVAQKLFTAHGFELDHAFRPGPYHWGLVFKRES
ncbi:MAG: methyltransferase domain-containing protein [Patescibacteria group bacterium]